MAKPKKNYKWQFAIGTTSRVPSYPNLHYLIADFDKPIDWGKVQKLKNKIVESGHKFLTQNTPNGLHLYSNMIFGFAQLINTLSLFGVDENWISIGESRGYFFLADKDIVTLDWPVERMVLRAAKNSKTSR